MGQYIELTKENFQSTIQNGVSLVDFWAPWCGPCRMLSPVIDKVAQDYADKANICKVNTDEQEELAAQYGIRSVPTILFFKDGQVVDQIIGVSSEQALKEKIDSLK